MTRIEQMAKAAWENDKDRPMWDGPKGADFRGCWLADICAAVERLVEIERRTAAASTDFREDILDRCAYLHDILDELRRIRELLERKHVEQSNDQEKSPALPPD